MVSICDKNNFIEAQIFFSKPQWIISHIPPGVQSMREVWKCDLMGEGYPLPFCSLISCSKGENKPPFSLSLQVT